MTGLRFLGQCPSARKLSRLLMSGGKTCSKLVGIIDKVYLWNERRMVRISGVDFKF